MPRLNAGARHRVRLTLNGRAVEGEAEPRMLLTDFLRHDTRHDRHACRLRARRVRRLHDRDRRRAGARLSHARRAGRRRAAPHRRGLAPAPGRLSVLQEAFRRHHALQCGFCTAGILMSLDWYLRDTPDPTEAELREFLGGHLCRCTGYVPIVAAALDAPPNDCATVRDA